MPEQPYRSLQGRQHVLEAFKLLRLAGAELERAAAQFDGADRDNALFLGRRVQAAKDTASQFHWNLIEAAGRERGNDRSVDREAAA